MGISFDFQIKKFSLAGKKRITEWIMLVAYIERREVEDIAYVFCDNPFLLDINRKYLKHAYNTDVITFDYSSQKTLNAEIYISVEQVRQNSIRFKVPLQKELRRVMIHGVLHCIGYSDMTKSGEKTMRRLEDYYLQLFAEMK